MMRKVYSAARMKTSRIGYSFKVIVYNVDMSIYAIIAPSVCLDRLNAIISDRDKSRAIKVQAVAMEISPFARGRLRFLG